MRQIVHAVLVLGLVPYFAQAGLIVNGSFESRALSPNSASLETPTGWQQLSGFTSLINGAVASGYPIPQDGQQYIGLGVESNGDPDAISQEFIIANAGTYLLRWFDTTPLGFGTSSPYSVSILDDNAQAIASVNLDAYSGTLDWTARSLQFGLNLGTYTIQLRGEPPIGHVGSALDNFSIENVQSVPEPSSLLMFLLSIPSLGLVVRRRQLR